MVRLGKAVPEDDDVRSLLVQLDAEAGGTHVDFRTIQIGGTARRRGRGRRGRHDDGAVPPGAVAVGTAGFSAMPFTFSFRGDFANLSQFFARMERFVTLRNEKMNVTGRLLRLESDRSPGRPERLPQHPCADRRQLLPGARDAGPDRGGDRAGPGGHDARGDPGAGRRPRRADDHRDRDRSHLMKPLENVWSSLMQRRLLPVAILLLGALVAVPFVLAKDPEPVAQAPAPAAENGAADRRHGGPRRHAGRRRAPARSSSAGACSASAKNPFQPAKAPKVKAAATPDGDASRDAATAGDDRRRPTRRHPGAVHGGAPVVGTPVAPAAVGRPGQAEVRALLADRALRRLRDRRPARSSTCRA